MLFFNVTPTTEIYTLSLHDALPICELVAIRLGPDVEDVPDQARAALPRFVRPAVRCMLDEDDHLRVGPVSRDRKSTRLNSSHSQISYAVFCLKKKKITK